MMKDPRHYMGLAITAMSNSVFTEAEKELDFPEVGAILVDPSNGKTISAAHGQYRRGEHAEYSIIERLSPQKEFSNQILFTTLEPFFTREHVSPEEDSARCIVKAGIKTVYIGVPSPVAGHYGKGVAYLRHHGVECHFFEQEFQENIFKVNRAFIESVEEQAQEIDEIPESTEDRFTAVTGSTIEMLDDKALREYHEKAKRPEDFGSEAFFRHLENIQVLERKDGAQVPSTFGILLFGKDPRETLPQAVVKGSLVLGGDSQHIEFAGPLVLLPDSIDKWIREALKERYAWTDRSNVKREEALRFPQLPLKEAYINALVHRDYDIEQAKIHIDIMADEIVIKSPGLPPDPIKLDDIVHFKAPSFSRNGRLTYIFNRMRMMEEAKNGMRTFRQLFTDGDKPVPYYTWENQTFLCLNFPTSYEALGKRMDPSNSQKLSIQEIKAYQWMLGEPSVSTTTYMNRWDIKSRVTATDYLKKLVELDLAEDNGENSRSPKFAYIAKPIKSQS